MGMATILFNGGGTIRINDQYPFDRGPHVKPCENYTIKNYTVLFMYIAQGKGR